MTENQYIRKIRKWIKKEGDSKEFREKIALWLLQNLNEEGDSVISSSNVSNKKQVITILFLLDEKWKNINKRVQIFNENGWCLYVWNKWKIPLMPMDKKEVN